MVRKKSKRLFVLGFLLIALVITVGSILFVSTNTQQHASTFTGALCFTRQYQIQCLQRHLKNCAQVASNNCNRPSYTVPSAARTGRNLSTQGPVKNYPALPGAVGKAQVNIPYTK